MNRRVLLLLDEGTLPLLADGAPPASPYSQHKNLFQFGHESLRRGWSVAVSAAQGDPALRPVSEVTAIYPDWRASPARTGAVGWAPDIVVAVHPEALNLRRHFPEAKLVALHAAVEWTESPARFSARYVFDLITAVRYNIDFIVTQTPRMAELLDAFYCLLARWPMPERILVAPLGIVAEERAALPPREVLRAEMGLAPDEIALVNAGGVWRWTDFNTLLTAFGEHAEASPDSRLRLFMMGLLQPSNSEHAAYVAETESLLYRFRALLGSRIVAYNDWADASRRVPGYVAGGDLGVNVNRPGLEHWQSYRVRVLDYMAAGVPVLQTRGDWLSEQGDGAHAVLVRPGVPDDYRAALDRIAAEPERLAERAAAMRDLARAFDSRITYGDALDRIEAMPRRADGDHAQWGDSVLDHAAARVREELRERLADRLGEFAARLLE